MSRRSEAPAKLGSEAGSRPGQNLPDAQALPPAGPGARRSEAPAKLGSEAGSRPGQNLPDAQALPPAGPGARRIVAVGGGGFLMDDASLLQERYLVSLCRRPAPRALFVGTASGDAERAQLEFMKAFGALGCRADTLVFFPFDMRRDYHQALLDADLVYVGGGNTPAMLAVWREFGVEPAMRDAYAAGTVFAGISAGANCWFERYITDSVPGGGVREGLGWLSGTFCPHLDSEAWRQPVLEASTGPAVGAGEHVAVCYENEAWHEAVASAPDGKAVVCRRRSTGGLALVAVEPRRLAVA